MITLPEQLRRPLTWDRGHEMADHLRFSVATGVDVYFCDPKVPGSAAAGQRSLVDEARRRHGIDTNPESPEMVESCQAAGLSG